MDNEAFNREFERRHGLPSSAVRKNPKPEDLLRERITERAKPLTVGPEIKPFDLDVFNKVFERVDIISE